MAGGTSVIRNPLESGDCLCALKAAGAFGAEITRGPGVWTVRGTDGGLKLPEDVLDCGNSGTTTNFVMSMAALCGGCTVITGDSQIRRRPVIELVRALNCLGAEAFPTRPGSDAPPVVIRGVMKGGEARVSGFNSQVISSLLLSAPLAAGDTVILAADPLEKPYLQMTLDWLHNYGVTLKSYAGDFTRFEVKGGQGYRARESTVSADWSAAAFPLVAAVCAPSEVVLSGLDFGDSQCDKAVVDILIAMGADIQKDESGGRLLVRGGKPLRGGSVISLKDIPDSLPALAVAACRAQGDTTFTGLAHVRVKETDRVAVMEGELRNIGAEVRTTAETMTVTGGAPLRGGSVESHGDHRIAMALTAAGLCAEGPVRVHNPECASVSFPGFFERMNSLGAGLRSYNQEEALQIP
jgi:3-phosphoshikimate 1-carboxyvinyltransferase